MKDRVTRILLIRPSALGDVCRTVPVLASLRRAFPDAEIDWLVQDSFVAAVAAHPAVSRVISFPRDRLASWWWNPGRTIELLRWLVGLRRRRYDLVFDCQGLGRSGFIARATGARRRVGFRGAREGAWLGYNVRHPGPTQRHTVDQMLELLEAEGIEPVRDMSLYATPEDLAWWRSTRESLGMIGESNYAVIAPTSRWPSKRWPIEHWRELLLGLAERGFERIIVIGSPAELDQVRGLVPQDRRAGEIIVDLVGRTTVGQTMAVVALAGVVIANDSAPLHMAVGFGRMCIGLFGPTDPAFVGPYRRDEAVIRKHDPAAPVNFKDSRLGDKAMRAIAPAEVLARLDELQRRRATADAFVERSTKGPSAANVLRQHKQNEGDLLTEAAP